MKHLVLTGRALAVLSLVLLTGPAAATPPSTGSTGSTADEDVLTPLDADEVREELKLSSYEEPPDGTGLWFAIGGSAAVNPTGTKGMGMLMLGGALERTVRSGSTRRAREPAPVPDPEEQTTSRSAVTPSKLDRTTGAAPPPPQEEAPPKKRVSSASHAMAFALPEPTSEAPPNDRLEPPPLRARITGALARGLVKATLRRAREHEVSERLDGLATRAKVSALLPEVRLRIARVVNEDQSLSPTEYDPARVTASGGTGFWLEGRATFKLDRLVFADEEVQIERLRAERARFESDLVKEVLGELATWQKGSAKAHDPSSPDDERLAGEAMMLSAAAALDVMSDGWFGEHAPE